MDLQNTAQLIKETQEGLLATETGVRQARDNYQKLSEEIKLAQGKLKYKKSSRHADVYVRQIVNQMKAARIPQIQMVKRIDEAVSLSSKEFEENAALYKTMLYDAADDEDIYLLLVSGSGWNSKLNPQIIFEKAGSLVDYARGVELYRDTLHLHYGEGAGANATTWWRRHVYGTSRYDRTIEKRVALSGRKAPFWPLIAFGTVALASDRPDGSYNPYPARGINFIQDVEDDLRKQFKELLTIEMTAWQQETEAYEAELQVAKGILAELETGVQQLSTEYRANQKILRKFGENAKYVNQDKLAIAARKYRAGEEFETKTVELTAPGSPKRIRPRVTTFEGLVEY